MHVDAARNVPERGPRELVGDQRVAGLLRDVSPLRREGMRAGDRYPRPSPERRLEIEARLGQMEPGGMGIPGHRRHDLELSVAELAGETCIASERTKGLLRGG